MGQTAYMANVRAQAASLSRVCSFADHTTLAISNNPRPNITRMDKFVFDAMATHDAFVPDDKPHSTQEKTSTGTNSF